MWTLVKDNFTSPIGILKGQASKDPGFQGMDLNPWSRLRSGCPMPLSLMIKNEKCIGQMQGWTRLNSFSLTTWTESWWPRPILNTHLDLLFTEIIYFTPIGSSMPLFVLVNILVRIWPCYARKFQDPWQLLPLPINHWHAKPILVRN